MRKLTLIAVLCSSAVASPAFARDGQSYVELGFGPLIAQDTDIVEVNPNTGRAATVDQGGFNFDDMGYDGAFIVGHDFGGFRTELEGSYRRTGFDSLSSNFGPNVGPGLLDGNAKAYGVMGNILADIGSDDGPQLFFGVGGGPVKFSPELSVGGTPLLDGGDWEFGWQGIAGLRAPLTESIDVSLRYRYFKVDDFTVGGDNGTNIWKGDFTTHSLLGTIAFNFGAPAAPAPVAATPPPPPPPPPQQSAPPPPPAPVCATGPYVVFFNWDKSDITPEAATILDSAVSAYSNCGTASVMLAGYTDTSGSAAYNMGLAERRNASVRSYLTSRGIPDGRISSEAFGENDLRVPTADGVRELQNRRVRITYGPGSGM